MNSMWSAASSPILFEERGSPNGGGGTPLDMQDLYGDVPLDRVWFLPLCPKQGT